MRRYGALAAALALALAVLLFVVLRVVIGRPPAAPAVVTTQMDAHEAMSRSFDARIARLIHSHGPRERPDGIKQIALTFDDGPFPVQTPLLLDVLADLRVPATFFLIGRDAQQYPDVTSRIAREGHEVGNHTLTHPNLDKETAPQIASELSGAANVLYPLTHDPSVRRLMRPPHGRLTEAGVRAAQAAGYNVIYWNDDPADERSSDPAQIADRIERHATQPDIILLHGGSVATIAMLPEVVDRARKAGYTFVTVGELLRAFPPGVIDHPVRQAI